MFSLAAAAAHGEGLPGAFQTDDDLRVICQDESVYLDVCLGHPETSPTIGAGSAFRALIEAFPCPRRRARVGPDDGPHPPPF